jgi:hypothetical protein
LRSDGRVVPGSWPAALTLPAGPAQGAFGLGPMGEEAAGLPAQRVAIVPAPLLRSALSNERVLSKADVEQYAATARDAAAAGSLSLKALPSTAARGAG